MSTNPTELVTAARASEILNLTLAALCFRRKKGSAPPWVDIAPPGHLRPKVRYRLSDILALQNERAPVRPTLAEVAERLVRVERALANLKRQKVKRRVAIKRRKRTIADSLL